MSEVYEGQVRVDDKKKDGSKLVISKGDRQGEPYYKVAFKVNDEWINLMDFAGVTQGQGGNYQVTYYQKFDPKTGQPDLYDGKPQYQLESIVPLEGQTSGQNAGQSEPTQARQNDGQEESPRKQKSIEMQTIIKAWGEVKAGSAVDPIGFASDVKAVWKEVFGEPEKNELDQMLSAAKDKLDATVEDDSEDDIPFD